MKPVFWNPRFLGAYFKAALYHDAIRHDFTKMQRLHETRAEYLASRCEQRAELSLKAGRTRKALRELERAQKICEGINMRRYKDAARIHEKRGDIYKREFRDHEAFGEYSSAIHLQFDIAYSKMHKWSKRESDEHKETIFRLSEKLEDFIGAVNIRIKQGRYIDAARLLKRAIERTENKIGEGDIPNERLREIDDTVNKYLALIKIAERVNPNVPPLEKINVDNEKLRKMRELEMRCHLARPVFVPLQLPLPDLPRTVDREVMDAIGSALYFILDLGHIGGDPSKHNPSWRDDRGPASGGSH